MCLFRRTQGICSIEKDDAFDLLKYTKYLFYQSPQGVCPFEVH